MLARGVVKHLARSIVVVVVGGETLSAHRFVGFTDVVICNQRLVLGAVKRERKGILRIGRELLMRTHSLDNHRRTAYVSYEMTAVTSRRNSVSHQTKGAASITPHVRSL
jgi:ATP phosphoribosyltransferase